MHLVPIGSGAISAPLRYALPDMPPIVIGKPNRPFLDSIEKIHKLDKSRTIMVGDRLDTDVRLAEKASYFRRLTKLVCRYYLASTEGYLP